MVLFSYERIPSLVTATSDEHSTPVSSIFGSSFGIQAGPIPLSQDKSRYFSRLSLTKRHLQQKT